VSHLPCVYSFVKADRPRYVRLYFRCFLPPLFCNGLLLDAHGQNSLLRYSRATGSLLGFSCRDMSGTRFNKMHFERTTGLDIDSRMSVHDMNIRPLLERAYFIFFVVHLCPLVIALDLEPCRAPTFTSEELLNGRAGDKEASDIADGIGSAVIVRELHEILLTFESALPDDSMAMGVGHVARTARQIWLEEPTWPLQCFVSQRMRADWMSRDKNVCVSHSTV
jgi:hypothetical protein